MLVSRFSALGDVAMTLPSVYDACAANPDVSFYYLTRHHPAQVFINRPSNLTMAAVNLDNSKGIGGLWRLSKALRKRYGITDYVDLHDVLRTKVLRLFMRMAGVRVRYLEKGRRAKKELTRRNNKVLVQLKPMPERYRDVFYNAGIALANDFDTLWGKGKGDPRDFAGVTPPKQEGEHWMAVAPFARHKGKIYPFKHLVPRGGQRGDRQAWPSISVGGQYGGGRSRHRGRTGIAQSLRCDVVDGFRQYASRVACGPAYGQRLGRHTSIYRISRLETAHP